MSIDATGNVGIGTTTPQNYSGYKTLEIQDTNGGVLRLTNPAASVSFEVAATPTETYIKNIVNLPLWFGTNNTERMRITAVGNVGIGTTTPNAKLDVNGNAIITGSLTVTGTITAQTLVVQTVTSSVSFITGSTRFGSTLSNTHQFTGSLSVTGGLAVNATTSNFTGSVNVNGSVNLTTDQPFRLYNGASFVGGLGSTNWAGGGVSTDTGLYSTNNLWLYAGTSVRMAISSSGNVGIGTTSPSGKLHVEGNTNAGLLQYIRNTNTGTSQYAEIKVGTSDFSELRLGSSYNFVSSEWNQAWVYAAGRNLALKTDSGFDIRLYAGGTTDVYERMRITSAGNVGIGTTSPNARLDVSGSAIVSGSFTVSPSNAVELQVTSTGVNLGNISTDIHSVTGSLRVNGSITGSLFGTASYATQALSASYAPGGGTTTLDPEISAGAKLYLFNNY
jgi:hypothetical protein